MITLESIESKINEYLNDKHDLTRSALDDLYKMYIVRDHLMEKTLLSSKTALNGDWIDEWAKNLQNEDGSIGAHWTKAQTTSVMQSYGFCCDPDEFYIAMNMMYADYSGIANAIGSEMSYFCAMMANAFLNDKDAKEDKLYNYYHAIVM